MRRVVQSERTVELTVGVLDFQNLNTTHGVNILQVK